MFYVNFYYLDSNISNNALTNNALTNNTRSPPTPAVHSSPAEGTITIHHQNGPVTLPIDDPLPAGYVNII